MFALSSDTTACIVRLSALPVVYSGSPEGLTRSLGPDVQVARLAVAPLVQCFAVGHEEEGRATSNDGQKDTGPATTEESDCLQVAFEGSWTYPRKGIVMESCYGSVGWFRWVGSTMVCSVVA
jgi:hypothetical protein